MCRNPDCGTCFNVVITGGYIDRKAVQDIAEAKDFKLCGDYWYCDRCETPEDELAKLRKQLEDQQDSFRDKEKQLGRLRFENDIYQDLVKQLKRDLDKLEHPFRSWWNKFKKNGSIK